MAIGRRNHESAAARAAIHWSSFHWYSDRVTIDAESGGTSKARP